MKTNPPQDSCASVRPFFFRLSLNMVMSSWAPAGAPGPACLAPCCEPAHERDAPPYSVAVAQGASTSLPPSPPCSRPDVPHPAKCCGSIVSVPPARADRSTTARESAWGSAWRPPPALPPAAPGGSGGYPPPASIAIRSPLAIQCPSTTTYHRHVPSQSNGAPAAAAGAGSARWWHLNFCGVSKDGQVDAQEGRNPELGSFSLISFL